MPGMKTTDHASAWSNATASPRPWYRVHPALLATLALSVAAWLGLVAYAAAPSFANGEIFDSIARIDVQSASVVLDILAIMAVIAVFVERARISGDLRKLQRRLVRSMRLTQRLGHGSPTARA
jgi:hypothetical protein